MICENCQAEHSGVYASGRFCGSKCARGFSTKLNRESINKAKSLIAKNSEKVLNANRNRSLKIGTRTCKTCEATFEYKIGSKQRKENDKKYCSLLCLVQSPEYREKARKSTLNAYANGKPVFGGTTTWIPYKEIKVQGSYEYRTCAILDHWKTAGKIRDWEYTNDRFDYVDLTGAPHKYLVDFKIYNIDNSIYYIETKGWIRPVDQLKWDAVRNQGIRLDIWFLSDIEKHESDLIHGDGGGTGRHTTL